MACAMISVFGAVFCGVLAICIGNNYQYLGEWYVTTEPHDSFKTQQTNAVKNCWIVAGIYGALAIVSTIGSCYYSAKAKRA